jgi:hypothetical protein
MGNEASCWGRYGVSTHTVDAKHADSTTLNTSSDTIILYYSERIAALIGSEWDGIIQQSSWYQTKTRRHDRESSSII